MVDVKSSTARAQFRKGIQLYNSDSIVYNVFIFILHLRPAATADYIVPEKNKEANGFAFWTESKKRMWCYWNGRFGSNLVATPRHMGSDGLCFVAD